MSGLVQRILVGRFFPNKNSFRKGVSYP
eukprot:COSAG02_NODE_33818_length_494_cov_0.529114_1_plen_27_part_10